MASRILCILALVALAAVLAEGKVTCSAAKKPNYAGLAAKFGSCLGLASKPGCATRCIIEKFGKDKPCAKKAEDYFAGVVPAKAKDFVIKSMKNCETKFAACKSNSEDKEGKSCLPLKDCFMGFMENVCKQ